jgi:hypothetical protein
MRKPKTMRTSDNYTPQVASENCRWCRGSGYVSVPHDKMIAHMGNIDSIIAKGVIAFIPTMAVCCPKCFPDGMKIGDGVSVLSLRNHEDRIRSGYPQDYWNLMITMVYLNLRLYNTPEYALSEIVKETGGGEKDIISTFIKNCTTENPTLGKYAKIVEVDKAKRKAMEDMVMRNK